MPRCFVAGVSGFVGSNLARRLIADGFDVEGLDAIHQADARRLAGVPLAKYHWAALDNFRGPVPEYVVFAAGTADVGYADRCPTAALDQSVRSLVALLEACRRSDGIKKVLLISSYSAYGKSEVQPIPEWAPLRPSSYYGSLKAMQEQAALSYWRAYGLPVVVVRSSTMYGPWGRATVPVSIFLRKAMAGEAIELTGSGRQSRDQAYVTDNCDGFVVAMLRGEPSSVFNIGSGKELSMLELAQKCIAVVGSKSEIKFLPERAGEEGRLVLDCSLAADILQHRPTTTLEQGLEHTMQWIKEQR